VNTHDYEADIRKIFEHFQGEDAVRHLKDLAALAYAEGARDVKVRVLEWVDPLYITVPDVKEKRGPEYAQGVDDVLNALCDILAQKETYAVNPSLITDARAIAQRVLDRDEPLGGIYPIPVGASFLYLSADPTQIIGRNTIEVRGVVFHFGIRRSDLQP